MKLKKINKMKQIEFFNNYLKNQKFKYDINSVGLISYDLYDDINVGNDMKYVEIHWIDSKNLNVKSLYFLNTVINNILNEDWKLNKSAYRKMKISRLLK